MNLTLKREGAPRLRVLDGWRAISVLLVIIHHVGAYQHPRAVLHIPGAFTLFDNWGPLGVKVFFVISGFVICRLLLMEEQLYGSISLKGFYLRRVARILPPFYLYLAAISLLLAFGLIRESWHAILTGALFLFDLNYVSPSSWFVGHTWSLAVEEQFYLVFPTLLLVVPRLWRSRAFLAIFVFICAWDVSLVFGGWESLTSAHTREGFACICLGVLSAIHETHARAIAVRFPAWIVATSSLVLLLYPPAPTGAVAALYECLFVPPAIALLLLFSLDRAPGLRSFLCCKPVQAVGLASYGIYLWQQLFTAPAVSMTASGAKPNFYGAGHAIPVLLPLLLLVVPLSFHFIEQPAIRFGRMLSASARKLQPVQMRTALMEQVAHED